MNSVRVTITSPPFADFDLLPEAFFNDNLRLQVRFLLEANRFLGALIEAARSQPDREATRTRLRDAERAGDAMLSALQESNHGAFEGWHDHAGRWGFRAKEYRDRVRILLANP